jgi:hypothetical protein
MHANINVKLMGAVHVLGPLLGGTLAAPLHQALTYCKNQVEHPKVKILAS